VMISNMSGVFQGRLAAGFTRKQVGYMGPPPSAVGPEHLSRRRLSERRRVQIVGTIAGGVALSMVVIATQSFRSLPLGEMGPVHLGLLAGLAMVLVVAYGSMVRAGMARGGEA
jgi:hypothetical protein